MRHESGSKEVSTLHGELPFSDLTSPVEVEVNLVLTFEELEILLYVRGFREVNGIRMPEKDFSAAEVLEAIKHLLDGGLISVDGEYFVLREDVKEVVDSIGRPLSYSVLVIGPEYPIFACYFVPGIVVTTQLHEFRERTLRIRMFREEEFSLWKEKMENDYREC